MASFEQAIKNVLKHEGGYVWHPSDPGGETNFGITDRLDGKVDGLIDVDGDDFGDIPVRRLTEDQARIIYRRKFWNKMYGDLIKSQQVAEILFDGFVNMGRNGIKVMQRVLGVVDDGVIGSKTLSAINVYPAKELFDLYKGARIEYYNDLAERKPAMKVFLKGWLNRINSFVWNGHLNGER